MEVEFHMWEVTEEEVELHTMVAVAVEVGLHATIEEAGVEEVVLYTVVVAA